MDDCFLWLAERLCDLRSGLYRTGPDLSVHAAAGLRGADAAAADCRAPFSSLHAEWGSYDGVPMIWLFALGIIGLCVFHKTFRQTVFWLAGIAALGVVIAVMAGLH